MSIITGVSISKAANFALEKAGEKLVDASLTQAGGGLMKWTGDYKRTIWLSYVGARSRTVKLRPLHAPTPGEQVHFSADGAASNIRNLCKILHRAMNPDFDMRAFHLNFSLEIGNSLYEYFSGGDKSPRLTLDLLTALASSIRFLDEKDRITYIELVSRLLDHVESLEFKKDFAREHAKVGHNLPYHLVLDANWARAAHRVDCLNLRSMSRPSNVDVLSLSAVCGDYNVFLNQVMVEAISSLHRGNPNQALAASERGLQEFKNCAPAKHELNFYNCREGPNSNVEVAVANVLRAKARALLILADGTDKSAIRRSMRALKSAYLLYVTQQPPWIHGIANTLLLAAGANLSIGLESRAHLQLHEASKHYGWTGDRAMALQVNQEKLNLESGGNIQMISRKVLMMAV